MRMIDLSQWNLSVPVGSPATTIDTPALLQGFKNEYFHADSGTLFFWAPVTGSKTVSAIYPRSELRETNADGSVRNWAYPSADNFLRAALTVNQVPSNGKIVIGQIHVYGSNEPLLKLEYQYKEKKASGNLVVKIRTAPDQGDPTVLTIAENVPLNQRFAYSIHLSPTGNLSITAADYNWQATISPAWQNKQLYFKAGVYTQDNTGYNTEGGMVTFYKLNIAHDRRG
jgi:hypothetical protein